MSAILLVEDDPLTQEMMNDFLELGGHTVEIAGTGEECLQKAESNPSVIILDMTLPDMTGKDVFHLLRNKDNTKDIPIIGLSGAAGALKQELKKAGINGYIEKPIKNYDELLSMISSWSK